MSSCAVRYFVIYHSFPNQFSIFEDVGGWQPWQCNIKSKMAATIQKTTTNKQRQGASKLSLSIEGYYKFQQLFDLAAIQVMSSCVHELSARSDIIFLRGLGSPETLLNFSSPLHCPSPSPPPPPSFNLLTLQAAVWNQESIGVWWGKNQRHATYPFMTPLTSYSN